jgi:hypothetical protein
MSTDGHLGSDEAFRNRFDARGWCVDSGVVCLAIMETTASCSHRMRCGRAGRVPDVPWAGATACPSSAIARRLLPNSRLYEMNALLARQFIRRQCHATFMVDPVAVQNLACPMNKSTPSSAETPRMCSASTAHSCRRTKLPTGFLYATGSQQSNRSNPVCARPQQDTHQTPLEQRGDPAVR